MMAGKKVIIRTLDIGADKQVDYFNGNEDNPAMGYRAIRICLNSRISSRHSFVHFSVQHVRKLSIMYPMIISVQRK